MKRLSICLSFSACIAACSPAQPKDMGETVVTETAQKLMTWPDLLSRPKPSPTHEISFGGGETDRADLWLPDGVGPHPVVLMVHGGCWQKDIADRTLMDYAAEDLRGRGLAVWNIEYRGVDEKGGGYPGTFIDAANATDSIRAHAVEHNLDITRLAAFGHSAGGHLAVWLAGRHKLPKSSPLYTPDPLPIPAVVNSGGLADLEASAPHTLQSCLPSILDKLTGLVSKARPNVFSDTSPTELLPIGAEIISVNGEKDGIAPVLLGQGITVKLLAAGDKAKFVQANGAGHVELIAPGTQAFEVEAKILEELLK